ncbi:MAG: hypothetical protein NXI27_19775 [Alphaproteobacteria bacterium]|nr:hypothetical protein [Alphaproteobacteria bacterium]
MTDLTKPSGARPRLATAAAIIALLFGALTVMSGGAVIFNLGQAQQAAGQYLPFVVWFNFLAGFAYILAGIGLFMWRRWAVILSMIIAMATLVTFAVFGLQVLMGAAYEPRTIGAMVLRSGLWVIIALLARASWKKQAGQ